MNIAKMNVQIVIEHATCKTDEIGNQNLSWELMHACFATVSAEAPLEVQSEARYSRDATGITFSVRYCKALKAIDSEHYRVRFDGVIYEIVGVEHMGFRKRTLKLICKKAGV